MSALGGAPGLCMLPLGSCLSQVLYRRCCGLNRLTGPHGCLLCRSRSYLENQMAVALGGRVAEELIFGEDNVTTGASNDFMQVPARRLPE